MGGIIRIGTRGSELALWQARHVAGLIGPEGVEIVVIKTKGDRIQNVSFDKIEGKGFFTKEIEEALLSKEVDLAVHSMKDLPTENTPGLVLAAITEREDPCDVLLVRRESLLAGGNPPLRDGAVVGTSSLRRVAQIKHMKRSLHALPLRGNVTTRVRRLAEGKFDAILLAWAGLKRLRTDLDAFEVVRFSPDSFLPAPAQGALALQVREGDAALIGILSGLNHRETALAVTAERCFLEHFGGGCHIPLGAYARVENGLVRLSGVVASTDGETLIRRDIAGSEPGETGRLLAEQFKKEGADRLL